MRAVAWMCLLGVFGVLGCDGDSGGSDGGADNSPFAGAGGDTGTGGSSGFMGSDSGGVGGASGAGMGGAGGQSGASGSNGGGAGGVSGGGAGGAGGTATGGEDQPCGTGELCDEGLVCDDGMCVAATCVRFCHCIYLDGGTTDLELTMELGEHLLGPVSSNQCSAPLLLPFSAVPLTCYVETPGGEVLYDGTLTPDSPDDLLLALSIAGLEAYAIPCDQPVAALCN